MNSSDVDAALIAKLVADPQLSAVMPDGVYWEEAAPGKTRFVIVSLVEETDEPMFGARAFEEALYLVKAVALASVPTAAADIKAAEARIDALLDPQPPAPPATLSIPGYGLMKLRRQSRLRITEVDETDDTIRWFHRGGNYELAVSGA